MILGTMKLWVLCAIAVFGLLNSQAADAVPDFKLTDDNRNSARYNSPVSPRDYLLQVSGYYFGEAS